MLDRIRPRFLPVLLCALVACGDDDDDGDAGTLTILFTHTVGGAALEFGGTEYTNAAGNTYTVSNLEYIVTDLALESADGSRFDLSESHYRDARRASTSGFTTEKVPSGTYSALLFRFGASSDVGFGELPTQDDYDNMEWPAEMGGGYHYMRLEGLFGDDQPLLSHTGPAGGADYSFVVELPLTLDVDGDDLEVHVVMDVNEWFADPVTYDFAGVGMMMGNTDAQLTHQSNGATVFGLGHIGPAREGSMAADDDMNGMDDEQADDDGHDHDH